MIEQSVSYTQRRTCRLQRVYILWASKRLLTEFSVENSLQVSHQNVKHKLGFMATYYLIHVPDFSLHFLFRERMLAGGSKQFVGWSNTRIEFNQCSPNSIQLTIGSGLGNLSDLLVNSIHDLYLFFFSSETWVGVPRTPWHTWGEWKQ